MKTIKLPLLLILVTTLLLSGCEKNYSSPEAPTLPEPGPPTIALASIAHTTKSVYLKGEPISVGFSISSTEISADNVIVDFQIVPVSELELLLAGAETTAEELGDFVVESIAPGLASYQADLVIPNNLIGDQDYVIIGMVDPQGNVTSDGDLEDNLSRGFNKNFNHPTTRVITVSDNFINDLSIENAEVGEGFILLETPASTFSDGMTASNVVLIDDDPRESNAVGHIDVKKLGADSMSAIIQVDVIVDGVETAAFMWKGDNDEWINEVPYDVPSPNEVHYVPWDIRLSPAQRDALFAAYDASSIENIATFRFRIQQTSGAQDENLANNSFELEVPFRFFTPGDAPDADAVTATAQTAYQANSRLNAPLKTLAGLSTPITAQSHNDLLESVDTEAAKFSFERSFSQVYGDKGKFGVGITFSSSNSVDGFAGKGQIYNGAQVNAYALGKAIELAKAFGTAEADLLYPSASYQAFVRVFGDVVIDEGDSASADISRDWGLQWTERKTFAQARFFAGPIPITIKAGASGSVGFGAGLALNGPVISGYGDLFYASLNAYATGGVDVGFASGGIGADLLLLQQTFRVSGEADLSDILNRHVTLNALAQNQIKAIQGRFYLFAKYPKYKFCCKVRKKTKTLTLYNTGALFDKTWDLVSESRTVSF
ncbi:hypothetical protein OAD22_09105 [Pseudomonadales bacterium]|nr:hypothetical protein [Pseudomonadales bacterium]MDB9942424.1 hypothetical protein [Pseudomonadales bacterium]